MSDQRESTDHPTIERISALVDDPGADGDLRAHLDRCARCRGEFERLSRLRMALSGLGELDPPAGEWERISARLEGAPIPTAAPGRGTRGGGPGGSVPGRAVRPWWAGAPLQAAAALILFGGGILAGLRLTTMEADPRGPDVASSAADAVALGDPAGATDADLASFAFEEIAEPLPEARVGDRSWPDPVAAAERLARLDALITASREAVSESPADPVANDLLFELVERREELAGRLHRDLHLTAWEVR